MNLKPKPPCRSCGRPANRPRQLCYRCFYTPGLRDLYPSISKFAVQGLGLGFSLSPLPDEPTRARPGSEEKIRVLTERAARRQSLFHPRDW